MAVTGWKVLARLAGLGLALSGNWNTGFLDYIIP